MIVASLFQNLFLVHINLTHVLANALLVLTTPLLDVINHHIVFVLNHTMTATAVTLFLIQNQTQTINTNPLLTLSNNPLHLFTIFPLRNLSLKLMFHPNTSSYSQNSTLSNNHANGIPPSSTWFVNLYILKAPEDTSATFKLNILFPLDSAASICVLNLPTFTILADHLLKC